MCGICGYYDPLQREEGLSQALLRDMCDQITHRGPDDEGYYAGPNIGLGMRRLSIIDLVTGQQPIFNEDGSIVIVFNGEFYNYIEEREILKGKGHTFSTKGDTEVIVHLYEEYGIGCLDRMRGMFAFALFDSNTQELYVVRDRFGIKPVFYYYDRGVFVFGSEIKSILRHKNVPRRLNLIALDNFFSWMGVPQPDTMFKDIRNLPPGSYLKIDSQGRISETKYWDLSYGEPLRDSEDTICENIFHQLEESVKLRLRSDVPVGVLLSGGVDSSTVAAYCSRLNNQEVMTFSVGFSQEGYSELDYAREVAQLLKTDHHEMVLTPGQYWDFVPKLIWHLDQPMADLAAVPLYYICKYAREHVKVLLSGEGSDEVFAGYHLRYSEVLDRFKHTYRLNRIGTAMNLDRFTRPFVDRLPETSLLMRGIRKVSQPIEYLFLKNAIYVYYGNLRDSLYTGELKDIKNTHTDLVAQLRNNGRDALQNVLYTDFKVNLANYLLVKADKMSMAASVELRVPFLDHKFIEYCSNISSDLKLRNGEGKYILKKAMSGILPEKILYREKMGFPVPLGHWMRAELKDEIAGILFDPKTRSRGLFNFDFVEDMWRCHQKGDLDYHLQLWVIVLLEFWFREFLDTA